MPTIDNCLRLYRLYNTNDKEHTVRHFEYFRIDLPQ